MQGIYKITNLINNKVYIGKTRNSERRWKDHQRLAFTPNHKEYNKALYLAIRKYGLDNFIFEIIEELLDYSLSDEKEQYWIKVYDSYNNGYNESLGGDGGSTKGHCLGEQNGRAKLTEADVILIRKNYSQGMSLNECYQLFKDKITKGGFSKVWQGKTWTHIMPEVYSSINKKKNTFLGHSQGGKKKRLLTNEEVRMIRGLKQEGKTYKEIQSILNKQISISTLQDVVYYKTYKEVL